MKCRFISTIIVITLILNGCANIKNDGTRTRTEGFLAGCLTGGLLGNLIGENRESALIGCAVGGLAGLAIGNHVANKKEDYANEEDYLNAVLAEAKKVNENSRRYNEQLKIEIAQLEEINEQLKVINSNVLQQKLALRKIRKQTKRLLGETRQYIAKVDNEIKIQQEVIAQERESASEVFVLASNNELVGLNKEARVLRLAEAQLMALDNRRAH